MKPPRRKRKQLSGPGKLALLQRFLVEKVPISDLCDQHELQPSQIYRWQSQLFEHGAAVFERKSGRQARQAADAKDRKIRRLEATVAQRDAKAAQKNEVIAELMEDNVRSKKAAG
jgi:transposase